MKIRPGLVVDTEALTAFCRRHHVRRLALFGSALGDKFGLGSDIDLLVEFEPGRVPGLFHVAGMELELADLFGGREVDFRPRLTSVRTPEMSANQRGLAVPVGL